MARSHSQSPGAGIHFKAGGSLGKIGWPSLSGHHPAFPHSAMPVKTPNPFKQARMMVRRSIGPAKSKKGQPY